MFLTYKKLYRNYLLIHQVIKIETKQITFEGKMQYKKRKRKNHIRFQLKTCYSNVHETLQIH